MNITRVKPPKFKVGRYTLNEYELRTLMLEVAKGLKPENIKVKDINGNTAIINSDGTLSRTLEGMSIHSTLTIELIKIRREIWRTM